MFCYMAIGFTNFRALAKRNMPDNPVLPNMHVQPMTFISKVYVDERTRRKSNTCQAGGLGLLLPRALGRGVPLVDPV